MNADWWKCSRCSRENPPWRTYCFACPTRNVDVGRLREVVYLYENICSFAEIARRWSLSAERIRQLYSKAKRMEREGRLS